MSKLAEVLAKKLDDEASELSTYDRGRIEAVSRSLKKRGELMVGGWIDMLGRLLETKPAVHRMVCN
jgi:ATP-dependent DNA helicase DinG